ncbi:export membrane protein SecD [Agrobacterium sp. RAC06]|nr:export membrane protein SecD [Agrobacterium sp. RAC06]
MKNSIAKVMGYMLVIVLGLLVALPNVLSDATLSRFPSFMPHERVSLGLDLRGGSHLVLEVDRPAMLDEWLQSLTQEARTALLEARIQTRSIRRDGDALAVTLANPAQLAAARQALAVLNNPAITVTGTGLPELDVFTTGGDTVRMAPTEQGITARLGHAVDQSLEVIRQRVDQVGVAEPTIQRVGGDRVLVQLPGEQDPSRLRALLGTTAKMSFHLLGEPGAAGVETLRDDEGRSYPVQATVLLAGDRLTDARVQFDQQGGQPVVSFRFDGVGAERFARITSDNVGRPFAIVLDDKVLSAPVIREPITGGAGQISGDFSVDEANTLAALLRAGALPAKLTVIEERTVGADLGGDAIEMGIVSGLAGFGLVVAFIVALYGAWGLLAVLALTLNVILTFAGLTIVGATLTLPGIAGIVLGIGLAVDANVLINERIREEAAKGRGAFAAIDQGFAKAYSTIIDSNVTALIATVLLFWFGSGPVRGFAVTMGLGIAISMFTAVSVVRVAMVAIARRWKLKTITIKPLLPFKLIKDGTRIDFMKARLFGIGVSAFLSISSIILFITPGLNYGVDFKGGIQLELSTTGPADLGRLRSGIEGLNLGEVALQEFGDSNHVMLRLERQPGESRPRPTRSQRSARRSRRSTPRPRSSEPRWLAPKSAANWQRQD